MRSHFPRWVWLFMPNTWCVDLYSCAWVWLVTNGIHIREVTNLKFWTLDKWETRQIGVISLYIRSGSIVHFSRDLTPVTFKARVARLTRPYLYFDIMNVPGNWRISKCLLMYLAYMLIFVRKWLFVGVDDGFICFPISEIKKITGAL